MFRDFARRKARKLRLTGTVRNKKDNTVEVIAEGEEDALKKLVVYLHKGPLLAEVEKVEEKWWETATGEFDTFSII